MLGTVTLTEQDGRLGVLPAGAKLLAIVGDATSGTLNSPAIYSRTKDVKSTFGRGRLVHAACYVINSFNMPVVCVRAAATTAATEATIDVTGVTGSSVVTYDSGDTTANDDYELYFEVVTGGTIGTAGITYQASLDGGRTKGPVSALGTATSYTFPDSGGVGFAFAAGTLVAGDIVHGRTTGPVYNSTDLGNAITALKQTDIKWEIALFVGPIDGTLFDVIEAAGFSGSTGILPKRAWIGNFRLSNAGESDSTYQTAFSTAFSAKATTHGMVCLGDTYTVSGADFLNYRRSPSVYIAALAASVKPHIDLADVNLGSAPGVSIRDSDGNVLFHDERIHGGGGDLRACTLTTNDEIQGVYVADPLLLSASGSDFSRLQHRRVINVARAAIQAYFARVLSRPIKVNRKTGKILESEASRLERGASQAVHAALMSEPMASGGGFTDGAPFVHLSREDLILSTFTLTGQASIVPLAYPKAINIEIGYTNPALAVRQV